jgi:hypothetical protein
MPGRVFIVGAVAIVAAALMSCREAPAKVAGEDTAYRARPGYVVDSARPIAVDLDRFRATLGPAPAELTGGAGSVDALVRRFAAAVQSRDTVALDRMQVSAAEYAWLIYPSSPLAKPPYSQPPQIAWMLARQASDVGLARLVKRRGGAPVRITGHECATEPLREGENRIWHRCSVRTNDAGTLVTERLFGAIVERHGHFKFLSYQNQY